MPLASKLAFQVEKKTQWKGYQIFHSHGIRVLKTKPHTFQTMVTGNGSYEVDLLYEEGSLVVHCTCPAYDKYGPCKHIWAAILEADKQGALPEAQNARTLRIVDLLESADFDEDEGEDEGDDEPRGVNWKNFSVSPAPSVMKQPARPLWRDQLDTIARLTLEQALAGNRKPWPAGFEIAYVLDLAGSRKAGAVVLDLRSRSRKKNGDWTVFKDLRLTPAQICQLPDPKDSELILSLHRRDIYAAHGDYYGGSVYQYFLPAEQTRAVLPEIASRGRLWHNNGTFGATPSPVGWDAGDPWQFWVRIRRNERDLWELTGELRRQKDHLGLSAPSQFFDAGFLLHENTLTRLENPATVPWIRELASNKAITFADKDRDAVLESLLSGPFVPNLDLDEELRFERRKVTPRFGLRLKEALHPGQRDTFDATPLGDYGHGFSALQPAASRGVWLATERVYMERDHEAEASAMDLLRELGVRPSPDGRAPGYLPAKMLPKAVRVLVVQGWHVEAEGRSFRRPGETKLSVQSGIDWFELHGGVDFEGQVASLPDLLAAVRKGDGMVRLGDGSFGMLPEDFLARFASLAGLGQAEDGHLRFRANQAALLDALLAAEPAVQVDELFERSRERLRTFTGIEPAPQPKGFEGQLRGYQLDGLGWIGFLRDFGFGGVLADDMGVGKTAQVLAALEHRRIEKKGPSLVVAPRSLLFNWRQEAERFTPQLKVLEHSGSGRDFSLIDDCDLVLTTYGTLQRDIAQLAKRQFDYVILDEAQAIKNASTLSAKAVRLLKGDHRLALSGTPVENHLGELWSLFEFLNPGMLGEAKVLKLSGGLARNPSGETRQLLSAALRPFILRRTKKQVAKELPDKTEQTIYCELEGEQLRKYNQLRDHYRGILLGKASGATQWNKMKIQVLEALLRLRQAACHPGLLDPGMAAGASAKFHILLAQLEEIRAEGHKALIFSQFTSLLALLKTHLDAAGFRYEYLDGATRDRQAPVERFQTDPDSQLFLISLKAGGLGLNLTAAGYVFLLDPWWNPAVEMQAIDRAHRIGQTQNVFAYRLIAKGTVEEKVLDLQKTKRDLADAILNEDNSLLRNMKREDLELLLS
ncbi:MAG: DEAD/DEAH box helicase [Bryobacterales bacterium]|nr:DEAD/DEAH box helicase [Bryobacterales bacterium]